MMNLIYSSSGSKSISNFLNFVRKKEANWSANDFSDRVTNRQIHQKHNLVMDGIATLGGNYILLFQRFCTALNNY